jgi:protocatechuate 3,4-dioxygenase beta subunit
MRRPGEWEVIRHVVRIAGNVMDEQGRTLAGVAVTLWTAPEPDAPHSGARASAGPATGAACRVRGRTDSRADGLYFFLDCAPGTYAVRAGALGGASVRVAVAPDGKVAMASADITLSPPPAAGAV